MRGRVVEVPGNNASFSWATGLGHCGFQETLVDAGMTLLAGAVADVTVVGDGTWRSARPRSGLQRRKENQGSEAPNRETGRPPRPVQRSPKPLAAVYRHFRMSCTLNRSRTVSHPAKAGFFSPNSAARRNFQILIGSLSRKPGF